MSLVNGTPRLKKLYAIWRISELVRCGKIPGDAEDFVLLDEILPVDQHRTQNLLLNLKTEVSYPPFGKKWLSPVHHILSRVEGPSIRKTSVVKSSGLPCLQMLPPLFEAASCKLTLA